MENISFVFTVCFVLLGPVKVIPAFARLTRDDEPGYRRRVAVWAVFVASAICLLIVGLGAGLVARYQISSEALHLGGGLVLLLSALGAILPRREPKAEQGEKPKAYQLAISPVATPVIVTPAGVAALRDARAQPCGHVPGDRPGPRRHPGHGFRRHVLQPLDHPLTGASSGTPGDRRGPGLPSVALAVETMLVALRSFEPGGGT